MAIFSVGDPYWVGDHPSLYHQIAVNRTCQDCINSYTSNRLMLNSRLKSLVWEYVGVNLA